MRMQQTCQVEGSEIVGAPVDFEAVPAQRRFSSRAENILVNACVVDQYMQLTVMVLPVPSSEPVDTVDIVQVERMGFDFCFVDVNSTQVVLQRIRHGRDVALAGDNDRGSPTRKDPRSFISERKARGAGDDNSTTRHVDPFGCRMAGEEMQQMIGGFGKRMWHLSASVSVNSAIVPPRLRWLPTAWLR